MKESGFFLRGSCTISVQCWTGLLTGRACTWWCTKFPLSLRETNMFQTPPVERNTLSKETWFRAKGAMPSKVDMICELFKASINLAPCTRDQSFWGLNIRMPNERALWLRARSPKPQHPTFTESPGSSVLSVHWLCWGHRWFLTTAQPGMCETHQKGV